MTDATTLMAVLAAIARLRGLDLTGYDPVVLSGQIEPYLEAYPGGLERLLHRIERDEAALDRLIETLTMVAVTVTIYVYGARALRDAFFTTKE